VWASKSLLPFILTHVDFVFTSGGTRGTSQILAQAGHN
jgi:hypothetical protein